MFNPLRGAVMLNEVKHLRINGEKDCDRVS
jgi:hypothetical protein